MSDFGLDTNQTDPHLDRQNSERPKYSKNNDFTSVIDPKWRAKILNPIRESALEESIKIEKSMK